MLFVNRTFNFFNVFLGFQNGFLEGIKEQNAKKKPKSRFQSGSIFERWESDGEDFINFHNAKDKTEEKKEDNK